MPEAEVKCHCGGSTSLVDADVVYKRPGFGKIFICEHYPACDSYVGARQDRRSGDWYPLGIPADALLRAWRRRAHRVFDRTWLSGWMTRSQAYEFMQKVMKLSKDDAHIGKFTAEQCQTLIEKLRETAHNERRR